MKYVTYALFFCIFNFPAYGKDLSGPAPVFTLTTMDGKKVSLSDYKDQVIMINFWASWCGPCREEMPRLNELYSSYKKAGFVILAINLDEDVAEARAFLKKNEVVFPVLSDPTGAVAEKYQNQAMPSSYFIDRKGNLTHLHQGYHPGEEAEYKKTILNLLAQ